MTSRLIDFLAAMFTAAAITILAIGFLLNASSHIRTNARVSVVSDSVSSQSERLDVLTTQVRELQARVTKLEGKRVIGEQQ